MDFKPLIDPAVRLMDPRIFSQKTPMGVKPEILAKNANVAQAQAVAVK